jgi:signal transduction histidine kinase
MRTPARPLAYLSAIALACLALAARALLHRWLGPLQPFAPGFVVIAASVLWLGWRPAILTALVSYLGGTYLFIAPGTLLSIRPQDITALIVFGASAGLVIFMGHRARMAEQQLAEANRQLAHANQQLRVADRKKDEFLATLSHELRNPIGVISNAATVLETGEQDPRRRTTIKALARQATQISRLVDDLLDVGRITRGRMELRTAVVDLRSCVEQAVEGNMHAIGSKRQVLESSLPGSPVELQADHARMVQVVSNLIDNASKYCPEHADIGVTLIDGEVVTLIVTDSGPGIDADVLPHVFDLFDAGGSSASGGLGLGLGLCKRIVEMHGGTIHAAENPRGRGASFTVRLPRTSERRVDVESSNVAAG